MIQTRAPSTPLATTSSASFNETNPLDGVASLTPMSALTAVRAKAVTANLDDGPVFIHSAAAGPALNFIAQGAPAPVIQASFSGVTLNTRKAVVQWVQTREVTESSNAFLLTKQHISEQVSPSIDALMWDALETDGVRPSGLRFGIGAETSGGASSMIPDLALLASDVSGVAGSMSNIVFVASPDIATKIAIALPQFAFPVIATAGISSATIICVAANALAIGAGSTIRFETSDVTSVHMEDTSPAGLSAVGTPNTVAAPIRSMFATDCVACRLIFEIDYKLRAANSLSWMTGITWGAADEE